MWMSNTVKKAEEAEAHANKTCSGLKTLRQQINGRKGRVFLVGPITEVQKCLESGGFILFSDLAALRNAYSEADAGYIVEIRENGSRFEDEE